ncbi:MAG: hypothetical protein ABSG81_16985 [Acidimicrobiales bacterium]
MSVKLTIIIDNPNDPGAFEAHYDSPAYRGPLGKVPDIQRVESAKVFPKEDGSPTPAYRTIDIYFSDYARHRLRRADVTCCRRAGRRIGPGGHGRHPPPSLRHRELIHSDHRCRPSGGQGPSPATAGGHQP